MTDCTACPQAAIAEPTDFLELADFADLMNFTELVQKV